MKKRSNHNSSYLIKEAKLIIKSAKEKKTILRLIGGLAIRFHCHGQHSRHLRHYHDIDFFGLSKDYDDIIAIFNKLGYSPNIEFNTFYGRTRLQFISRETSKTIDVFLDKFRMDHQLDFRDRLALDNLTIPITDLLLTKLQIAKLNRKDLKDIIAIIEDHSIGDNDSQETLNLNHISELCSNDWGLYKTISLNMETIKRFIEKEDVNPENRFDLKNKLNKIEDSIEQREKKLRWKFRNLIGEKVKWYEDVETGQGEI